MSTATTTTPVATAATKPAFSSVISLPSAVLALVATSGYPHSAIPTTAAADGWAPPTINRMAIPASTLFAKGLTAGVLRCDALGTCRATAVAHKARHHGPARPS